MKSISTIFRELDQIKKADIPEELKAAFTRQKHAELAAIGQTLGVQIPAPVQAAEDTGGSPRKPPR